MHATHTHPRAICTVATRPAAHLGGTCTYPPHSSLHRRCQHPQTDFKGVSMYRPKKEYEHETSAVASRDKMLARGIEQKWVNG